MFFEISTLILYFLCLSVFLCVGLFIIESSSYQKGFDAGKDSGYSLGSTLGYTNCLEDLRIKGVIQIDDTGKITGIGEDNNKK